jgi:restriction system protein
MHGPNNVSHRHDDALSRVGWAELECLLATYYREVGWWVEHAGTGGTGTKFDGGVELRIRRNAEVVLVQCKYWNAGQVPHDALRELLDAMVSEGATGAILVSDGEFTCATIDAAQRHGQMKLIDGHTLRGMLGHLPHLESDPEPLQKVPPAPAKRATRMTLVFWLVALAFVIAGAFIVWAMSGRIVDTARTILM